MPDTATAEAPKTTATADAAHAHARGHRKERVGKVLANKMAKTIVVQVERRFPHPKYKKVITTHAKFYVHDEKSEARIGDLVLIQETRPLSKLKRWRLKEIVERSKEDLSHGHGHGQAAAPAPAAA